ncbi:MAG: hypothetical protein HFG80_06000 [Eubacterium sp.]|nr:hypothetical protein [Eubacterium sp.]
MKEAMIMNCVSVAAGALAIAVACKITKSAWPLLAFIIVPTWSTTEGIQKNGK